MLNSNHKISINHNIKLLKFYSFSLAQVVKTIAFTETQARKKLGKQSLIFIASIRSNPLVESSRNWRDYCH